MITSKLQEVEFALLQQRNKYEKPKRKNFKRGSK